jgi:CheY-like chemotaxis protein
MTASKRILLVEDDRFLRRACEVGLRQRGYAVESAVDGEEGLRAVAAAPPDLILLDLLMPKVTGLEFLRKLRADPSTQALSVLVLSNSSREQDMEEITRLGVVGHYVKADLSLQELGERVAELLGS